LSCPAIAVRRTAFFQNAYVPGIPFRRAGALLSEMAGTSPAMTVERDGISNGNQ
jgi:hypothetical protein